MRSIQLLIAPETAELKHMYVCMICTYVRRYVRTHVHVHTIQSCKYLLNIQYKGGKKNFSLNWSIINSVNS